MFDGFGAGIAARASQLAEADAGAALSREASAAGLQQRLEHADHYEAHLRSVIATLAAERDAARASPPRRLTAALRRAGGALRHNRIAGAALPPTPHHLPEPDRLAAFLATGYWLPRAARPAVSVFLVAEGAAVALHACLFALAASELPDGLEVVIAAQESSQDTASLLDRLDGARILPGKAGLVAALREAQGDAVLLLDSRVRLLPGAIAALLDTLRATPGASALGGKIIGLAGAVIQAGEAWDAAGALHAHGAGLPRTAPEVRYRRTAPSCSAAMLLVRARLLRQLVGISPGFAGTSHAGADICRRLSGAGWQTVYEPLAEAMFGGPASPDAASAMPPWPRPRPATCRPRCRGHRSGC